MLGQKRGMVVGRLWSAVQGNRNGAGCDSRVCFASFGPSGLSRLAIARLQPLIDLGQKWLALRWATIVILVVVVDG